MLRPMHMSPGSPCSGYIEASRAICRRYPHWSASEIDVSGSLGVNGAPGEDGADSGAAAHSLLLLNVLEGVDLDQNTAIAGGVDMDWKLLATRAVGLKLKAAREANIEYVVLPAQNAEIVDDVRLTEGNASLWQTQVLAASSIQQAQALARKDREPRLAQALSLFEALQKNHGTDATKGPASVAQLRKIVELCPEHLSAASLLASMEGTGPRTLSPPGSLHRIAEACGPAWFSLFEGQEALPYRSTLEARHQIRGDLAALRPKVNAGTVPLIDRINEYLDLPLSQPPTPAELAAIDQKGRAGRAVLAARHATWDSASRYGS
jgi:hypothetical protein